MVAIAASLRPGTGWASTFGNCVCRDALRRPELARVVLQRDLLSARPHHETVAVGSGVARLEQGSELLGAPGGGCAQVHLGVVPGPCQRPVGGNGPAVGGERAELDEQGGRRLPLVLPLQRRGCGGAVGGAACDLEVEHVEEAGGVAAERPVVAVQVKEALDLGADQRQLPGQGGVAGDVGQRTALEAVEEQEHVADVGLWVAAAAGQPCEVGGACLRGDLVVAGPVAHRAAVMVRAPRVGLEAGVDECGLGAAVGSRGESPTDVEHPARNRCTRDGRGRAGSDPLGVSAELLDPRCRPRGRRRHRGRGRRRLGRWGRDPLGVTTGALNRLLLLVGRPLLLGLAPAVEQAHDVPPCSSVSDRSAL